MRRYSRKELALEPQMTFASAVSTSRDLEEAVVEISSDLHAGLEDADVDLAVVFYTPHYGPAASLLARRLHDIIQPGILLGCMGQGVIGHDREIENEPGIAVTAGGLPGVALQAVEFKAHRWAEVLRDTESFGNTVGASTGAKLFLLAADPFTTPADPLLNAFNSAYPGVPIIGGMASGAKQPRSNCLILNDRVLTGGAVAVSFEGLVDVDVIVSQGCRPVGRPFLVTEAKENVILNLEGESPLNRIQEMINEMSDEDRAILDKGLFVGRAIALEDEQLGRGGFLIRGVMGVDRDSGALAVGDVIEEGETIQFHLRDARTAKEDLEMMLTPQSIYERPRGGFLFSCNGRGTNLFDHPNGDVDTIRDILGEVNLAGFFCAGEIGPVGGKNFLHGHTASLAFLRPSPIH
jgi:small ligand-binding sensory domain FIST